jgi:hypothetical protein
MILNATAEQRAAAGRAAELIAQQAEGLRRTESKTTEAALRAYAETLRRIADNASLEVGVPERLQVENASFVLEGIRDGLLTAEFRDRAQAINADIRSLNDIVEACNSAS